MGLAVGGGLSPTAVLSLGLAAAFTGTGVLVAARQPRNAIGWLFLIVGCASALALLTPALADRLVAGGGAQGLPTRLLACYASVSWVPMMLPPQTFLLLLFPDGHLSQHRWRFGRRCAGAVSRLSNRRRAQSRAQSRTSRS